MDTAFWDTIFSVTSLICYPNFLKKYVHPRPLNMIKYNKRYKNSTKISQIRTPSLYEENIL